jgi:hypothetical protein
MMEHRERSARATGPVWLLGMLLTIWEPVGFALVAAGAFNAISVRGAPVVLILLARLGTTALAFAAGRALLDVQPGAPALTRAALSALAAAQLIAELTPWFPTNRLPGDTPLYVAWTLAYYGGWLLYVVRSRRVAALFG